MDYKEKAMVAWAAEKEASERQKDENVKEVIAYFENEGIPLKRAGNLLELDGELFSWHKIRDDYFYLSSERMSYYATIADLADLGQFLEWLEREKARRPDFVDNLFDLVSVILDFPFRLFNRIFRK